jgi:hypothetical protein
MWNFDYRDNMQSMLTSQWTNRICPNAEKLFDQLIWLETCGNHIENNAYQHCAKVEVEAYALWMRKS